MIQEFLTEAKDQIMVYAPKLITAIVVLVIGLLIIKYFMRFVKRKMGKIDPSLKHFLASVISVTLKVLLFVTVLSMLGVAMTSFIAILGAAGLAVGLALQGSLANFAGGVLILIFKPFKVKDLIEAQGHLGVVEQIQIFNTILVTLDNKEVVIPNGKLSNESLVNYTAKKIRRVDMTFGISYDDDFKKAKTVLENIIKKYPKALKDPAPLVRMGELGDSSVNFTFRVWCKTEDYWDVYFDMHEAVKEELDKAGITIPYPQRDVHLIQKD
jgi:small conductance mechanosensitive channel